MRKIKIPKDTNKEMKHYLGVMNEMHGETLKGIKEGFIIVNRKLDAHSKILDEHSKILDRHSKILDEHSKKLDSHTEMIGVLMEDVSVIKSDLKRKVDYDDFLSLVRRVQKLEGKI